MGRIGLKHFQLSDKLKSILYRRLLTTLPTLDYTNTCIVMYGLALMEMNHDFPDDVRRLIVQWLKANKISDRTVAKNDVWELFQSTLVN